MRKASLFVLFLILFAQISLAGFREVTDASGNAYLIDSSTHRVYSRAVIDNQTVWVGSDRSIYFGDVVSIAKNHGIEAFDDLRGFISGKRVHYGPMNEGPLHQIQEGPVTVADIFRSSSYFETTLEKEVKLYRVYSEDGRKLSRYWSRTLPTGPYQAVLDSALDPAWGNKATRWVEITVPAGEVFYEGAVSPIALKANGLEAGKVLGGLRDKYEDKISGVSISEMIDELIKTEGGLEQLIGTWKGDSSDQGGFYLIKTEKGYESFAKSDRGGQEGVEVFKELSDAVFTYIDNYFNELGYAAPDSIINRKRS